MASKKKGGGKEGPGGGEGGAAPKHILHWTVHLLANCTKDDIEQLEKLHGVQRCVAFYRSALSCKAGTLWLGMLCCAVLCSPVLCAMCCVLRYAVQNVFCTGEWSVLHCTAL